MEVGRARHQSEPLHRLPLCGQDVRTAAEAVVFAQRDARRVTVLTDGPARTLFLRKDRTAILSTDLRESEVGCPEHEQQHRRNAEEIPRAQATLRCVADVRMTRPESWQPAGLGNSADTAGIPGPDHPVFRLPCVASPETTGVGSWSFPLAVKGRDRPLNLKPWTQTRVTSRSVI